MLVHQALRLKLVSDAGIAALVGTRIYPTFAAQSTDYPAVAYRLVAKEPVRRINEGGHSGLCRFRFRLFSACDKANGGLDVAKNVDEAIRLVLEGFQGRVTNTDVSPEESVSIGAIMQATSNDGYVDESQTYQVVSDYDIWAVEQQPA